MITKSTRPALALMLFILLMLGATQVASAPELPNPVIYFTGAEPYTSGKEQLTRYSFDVFNKEAYPPAMFAAAPELPPCGKNTKASRTWVDIYTQSGKRLNGFCALSKPADLNQLWFALPEGEIPPSYVYIELSDRQTNTKYKSNLAETSL